MNFNTIVKDQFNKQATNFDNWCTPKNLDYLKGFSEFASITKERFLDNLNDDMREMKFRRQVFLISGVKH